MISSPIDDPWSTDTNGRNSVITTATNDPWQIGTSLSTSQANPWTGNNHSTTNNGAGLSVNISDPWGVGSNDSRTTISPPTASKTVDNELSEFFGANASKISSLGTRIYFSNERMIVSFNSKFYDFPLPVGVTGQQVRFHNIEKPSRILHI